jgi:hypothetical protein
MVRVGDSEGGGVETKANSGVKGGGGVEGGKIFAA